MDFAGRFYARVSTTEPSLSSGSVVGISVAIVGNVIISFALNLQKLAHKRLDEENRREGSSAGNGPLKPSRRPSTVREETIEDDHPRSSSDVEAQPLLSTHELTDYGTSPSISRTSSRSTARSLKRPTWLARFLKNGRSAPANLHHTVTDSPAIPVEVLTQDEFSNRRKRKQRKPEIGNDSGSEHENETKYLKSKLWWTGFLLMNVGEVGNFISYAWAPASVVAPLGTFALVANCLFAPLMLGERFRKRDLFGILVAIIGAVTVVLSSNSSNTRLKPDELVAAVKKIPFVVYSCIYLVGAIVLSILSQGEWGRRYVFVDVGLCALFGGFTVLSTKAVSTLLTMEWFVMFTKPITYPVIAVLIVTGVGQIRYLNRALMRFDSKTVVPIQFALFNLSAILGSAILYQDFYKASFHQIVTFLYGCCATFAGVFIMASSSAPPVDAEVFEPATETEDSASETEHEREHSPSPPSRPMTPTPNGTLGRRRGAMLILPNGVPDSPLLRKRNSSLVMGLSPAQPLLLVHTPTPPTPLDGDRLPGPSSPGRRRRAISMLEDGHTTISDVRRFDGTRSRTTESLPQNPH